MQPINGAALLKLALDAVTPSGSAVGATKPAVPAKLPAGPGPALKPTPGTPYVPTVKPSMPALQAGAMDTVPSYPAGQVPKPARRADLGVLTSGPAVNYRVSPLQRSTVGDTRYSAFALPTQSAQGDRAREALREYGRGLALPGKPVELNPSLVETLDAVDAAHPMDAYTDSLHGLLDRTGAYSRTGGVDAAMQAALKSRAGDGAGPVWTEASMKRPTPVYATGDAREDQLMAGSTAANDASAVGTYEGVAPIHHDNPVVVVANSRLRAPGVPTYQDTQTYLRNGPMADHHGNATLAHELTHQAYQQPDRLVPRSGFDAHTDVYLAQLKRLYADQTGHLVDSPEEAAKAIQWYSAGGWREDDPGSASRVKKLLDGNSNSQGLQGLYRRMPQLVRRDSGTAKIAMQPIEPMTAAEALRRAVDDHAARLTEKQELEGWKGVPARVRSDFKLIIPRAKKIAAAVWQMPELYENEADAYWNHKTDALRFVVRAWVLPRIKMAVSRTAPDGDGWILIKSARGLLAPVGDAVAAVQKPFGGPNPLTASLLGGAVGAGLGYGGGWLLDQALPEKHFDPEFSNRRRSILAGLGGMAGATPGLAWGGSQYLQDATKPGQTLQDRGAGWTSSWPLKTAEAIDNRSGLLFTPSIPVDAFNQMIWSNTLQHPNPFGTKSQWGTNEQSLYTPPQVAAAASGALAGAAAARGQESVSPWDVAVTAAIGGAQGLAGGLVLGKTLGALAGLRPESQQQLQRLGLWSGILAGAVNAAFPGL